MDDNKCPINHKGTTNRDWWPNQLNLGVLHQHTPAPMGYRMSLSALRALALL